MARPYCILVLEVALLSYDFLHLQVLYSSRYFLNSLIKSNYLRQILDSNTLHPSNHSQFPTMATELIDEISTKVQESLKDGPYECSSLTKLSGGTANFVYRGTLKTNLNDGTETVVIKHTEGYSASNKNFPLADSRCVRLYLLLISELKANQNQEYEQQILTALHTFPPLFHHGLEVRTPHLYHFDTENNTQIYEDLSSSLNLKFYVLTHSETLTQAQCQRLGHALGAWCKSFHVWGKDEERKELRDVMKGNKEMRELKFMVNYQMLINTVDNFPELLEENRSLFEDVKDNIRRELDERDGELIHGDFWTGKYAYSLSLVLNLDNVC